MSAEKMKGDYLRAVGTLQRKKQEWKKTDRIVDWLINLSLPDYVIQAGISKCAVGAICR